MLVGSIRRILHDANVNRLGNRYSNRLSCVVVDEARGTFEEDIARVLEDVELAERLQCIVAATLPADGKLIAPAPPHPNSPPGRPNAALVSDHKGGQPLPRAG